jgi:2-polyprenyl-6-methoxyphenol hydroxylase-like FAD-dependent oxidoreductase
MLFQTVGTTQLCSAAAAMSREMSVAHQEFRVLISGAGPVGLAAARALSLRGIAVSLFEKRPALTAASKASTFHPPTLDILARLGVIDAMLAQGARVDAIQYRTAREGVFAHFPLALLGGETRFPFRLHLEQSKVTPLLAARLGEDPRAQIRFGYESLDAASDADGVTLSLRREDGRIESRRGAFLIVAEGGGSTLRDRLGIGFPGSAYAHKVLRVMTTDDLEALLPGLAPVTYVFNGARSMSLLRMPECWRIILRVPGETEERAALEPPWILARLNEVLPKVDRLPTMIHRDVYGASRNVAATYRHGRIGLIGDAAHLTNTRGGMNMNCGIHDAHALAAALQSFAQDGDLAAVHACLDERRRVAEEMLIPRTDRNVAHGPEWLDALRRIASDRAEACAYLRSAAMLDMVSLDGDAAQAMARP